MKDTGQYRSRWHAAGLQLVVLLLCQLLALQPALAQQPASTFGLKVKTGEGNGASTPVKSPSTEPPVVVVLDANERPVQGALVVFTAPDNGASGVFEDGSRAETVATDRDGKAAALGYRANATAGSYPVAVHVDFLGETVDATVTHTNVAAAKSSKKMIMILAIAGGGAAGALLAVSGKGGGGSTSTPPVNTIPTITFGGSTVGGQ